MTERADGGQPQKIAFATPNFRVVKTWLGGTSNYDGNIFGYLGDMEEPDWLIVYHDLDKPIKTSVPRERRIAILAEPPEILHYERKFAEQFGVVLGVSCPDGYSGIRRRTHIAHPSFYGLTFEGAGKETTRYSWADLLALPRQEKKRKVTAVLSQKAQTPMHRQRLDLVERLKFALGDDFLIFGRGFTPIADKAEVIDGFKYHLALENCAHEDHWTEKLSDPLVGWSLPIYAGCPNLSDYIPLASYIPIDLIDIGQSVETVRRVLCDDPYEKHIDAIAVARKRIIDDYNILKLLNINIDTLLHSNRPATEICTIWPRKNFREKRSILPLFKQSKL